ncbi:MAG: hypothetical protein C9356_04805 [Oleiphilus sp.]|nr:MAG: hypothetical protein C9356_04805 [Oleiphilus sp.]
MRNRQPIFVNGVARGGTNILMNILLSHPDTAMPSGELQKVIRGYANGDRPRDNFRKKYLYELPLSLLLGKYYFALDQAVERKKPSRIVQLYIDWILYNEKVNAGRSGSHNFYRSENEKYLPDQLKAARLVCKNISALVYLTPVFQQAYPDASFVCVTRNGLALLESHIRRGHDIDKFIDFYHEVSQRMLEYRACYDNYMTIRYEDIVDAPIASIKQIYSFVKLDYAAVQKFRFQRKSTVDAQGKAIDLGKDDRSIVWYSPDTVGSHFKSDINTNQLKNIQTKHKDKFLAKNAAVMEALGYPVG